MGSIAGIINCYNYPTIDATINKMNECMVHEQWYRHGTYSNRNLFLSIGWTCIKDSFCDCLPIINESKDLILFLTGECAVDEGIIIKLNSRGHHFDQSRANYLIHLYEEDPATFFRSLNGRFSGLIADLRQEKVILFNDRYGMGRIYYYEGKDGFLFSSEAKSILRVRPELRRLDPRGLGEFFTCDCVLENRTLFPNIFLLPGGSVWTFRKGKLNKKEFYFKPNEWESSNLLDGEIVYRRLTETFRSVLPRYINSQSAIGLSLTGGIDTRMILAFADVPPGSLPCYTFGSMYRESRDVKVAKKVAKYCCQQHHVLPVGKEFLERFPDLAEKTIYITDGGLEVTGAPELYINRLARQIAPIRLTGNYGQEVLNRDIAFNAHTTYEKMLHKDFSRYMQSAQATFKEILNTHPLSFVVFRQAPWFHYRRLSLEQSQMILRTPFMDNDIVQLMYQAPPEVTKTRDICIRLIRDNNPGLAKIITDRGYLGALNTFSFFNRSFHELLFKAEYCYDYGMPKWMANVDHTFSFLHFERLFLGRHKFCHFRVWFRDALAGYVKAVLLDQRTLSRQYLNARVVQKMVQGHTRGIRNHTMEIVKLLTIELIERLLIEQEKPR